MTEPNIQQPKQYNILLIGDDGVDIYQYGLVDRISSEAPVPIFTFQHATRFPGMGGNVLQNLQGLGCNVRYLYNKTSIKTRLINARSNRQILRIDDDVISTPLSTISNFDYDAIVISDYNKGTISYELIEEIIANATCPIFIDTKKTDLKRFSNAWVKINELEYSKIVSECVGLIVTKGAAGATLIDQGINYPAPEVVVHDITGAGDTFLAALTFEYLNTGSIEQAIKFAIRASAITVQHFGVYAPTDEEIR
jgi:D-beta-D-heptose 7-phosphate kinase/D-beta-D-heptose 1-phosphate adenosyltransferase